MVIKIEVDGFVFAKKAYTKLQYQREQDFVLHMIIDRNGEG